MQENYLISIIGKQNVGGELGEVSLTTFGSYIKKGDHYFIAYKEYDTENNAPPQTSILKITNGSTVSLMRGGPQGTRLILEKGKRHLCQYDTGFGNLMIGIFTQDVDSNLSETGGTLQIRYTMDIDSNLSSLNEISITVKEANNNDVKISTAGNG